VKVGKRKDLMRNEKAALEGDGIQKNRSRKIKNEWRSMKHPDSPKEED
jgi:hypothetical protein